MAVKKSKKKAGTVDKNIIFTTGKRKKAVARARFKPGSGTIKINSIPLELITNEVVRLKIKEPLMITGDNWQKFDIKVNVQGGGIMGQAEATRLAIAKGLAEIFGGDLREKFLSYDKNLLIADTRRTEVHKPPHSSWGARRYKQRSKR